MSGVDMREVVPFGMSQAEIDAARKNAFDNYENSQASYIAAKGEVGSDSGAFPTEGEIMGDIFYPELFGDLQQITTYVKKDDLPLLQKKKAAEGRLRREGLELSGFRKVEGESDDDRKKRIRYNRNTLRRSLRFVGDKALRNTDEDGWNSSEKYLNKLGVDVHRLLEFVAEEQKTESGAGQNESAETEKVKEKNKTQGATATEQLEVFLGMPPGERRNKLMESFLRKNGDNLGVGDLKRAASSFSDEKEEWARKEETKRGRVGESNTDDVIRAEYTQILDQTEVLEGDQIKVDELSRAQKLYQLLQRIRTLRFDNELRNKILLQYDGLLATIPHDIRYRTSAENRVGGEGVFGELSKPFKGEDTKVFIQDQITGQAEYKLITANEGDCLNTDAVRKGLLATVAATVEDSLGVPREFDKPVTLNDVLGRLRGKINELEARGTNVVVDFETTRAELERIVGLASDIDAVVRVFSTRRQASRAETISQWASIQGAVDVVPNIARLWANESIVGEEGETLTQLMETTRRMYTGIARLSSNFEVVCGDISSLNNGFEVLAVACLTEIEDTTNVDNERVVSRRILNRFVDSRSLQQVDDFVIYCSTMGIKPNSREEIDTDFHMKVFDLFTENRDGLLAPGAVDYDEITIGGDDVTRESLRVGLIKFVEKIRKSDLHRSVAYLSLVELYATSAEKYGHSVTLQSVTLKPDGYDQKEKQRAAVRRRLVRVPGGLRRNLDYVRTDSVVGMNVPDDEAFIRADRIGGYPANSPGAKIGDMEQAAVTSYMLARGQANTVLQATTVAAVMGYLPSFDVDFWSSKKRASFSIPTAGGANFTELVGDMLLAGQSLLEIGKIVLKSSPDRNAYGSWIEDEGKVAKITDYLLSGKMENLKGVGELLEAVGKMNLSTVDSRVMRALVSAAYYHSTLNDNSLSYLIGPVNGQISRLDDDEKKIFKAIILALRPGVRPNLGIHIDWWNRIPTDNRLGSIQTYFKDKNAIFPREGTPS